VTNENMIQAEAALARAFKWVGDVFFET